MHRIFYFKDLLFSFIASYTSRKELFLYFLEIYSSLNLTFFMLGKKQAIIPIKGK